jgi:hypothetical protein
MIRANLFFWLVVLLMSCNHDEVKPNYPLDGRWLNVDINGENYQFDVAAADTNFFYLDSQLNIAGVSFVGDWPNIKFGLHFIKYQKGEQTLFPFLYFDQRSYPEADLSTLAGHADAGNEMWTVDTTFSDWKTYNWARLDSIRRDTLYGSFQLRLSISDPGYEVEPRFDSLMHFENGRFAVLRPDGTPWPELK